MPRSDAPAGSTLLPGTALDPGDAAAREEVRAIEALLRAVPVPSAELPGWQSLCASEYAGAVRLLVREIGLAADALALAARAVP